MEIRFQPTRALPEDVPSATVRGEDAVVIQINERHFASTTDADKVCRDLSGNVDSCAGRDWVYIGDVEVAEG